MTRGRPKRWPIVLRTIADADSPVGMTCAEIAEATGFGAVYVSTALSRLRDDGKVFGHGINKYARYFLTAERMAECIPNIEAMKAQQQEERRQREWEKDLPRVMELKAKRESGNMPRVLAALQACTDPLGATNDWLHATLGLKRTQVSDALSLLRAAGKSWKLGQYHRELRHFASAERMEQARPAYEAMREAQRKAIAERKRAKRRTTKVKVAKPVKPPKPVKVVKPPKPVKPAKLVTVEDRAKQRWSSMEPVYTPATVHTICPSGRDERFYVDPASIPRIPVQQWGRKPFAALMKGAK